MALPERREPHWQKLARGSALGFRRGPNTWLVRFIPPSTRKGATRQWQALNGIGADDFDGAKRAAEEWLEKIAGSGVRSAKRATVEAALRAYLADLRRHGRADTAREAEGRFKTCVWRDPIAALSFEDVTREDVAEWRERVLTGRKARTVARYYRSLRAAANAALALGYVGNEAAWKLRPLVDAEGDDEGETAVFLTPAQRRAIVEGAAFEAGDFLRGLELTGARPKELAAALVSDFDGSTLRLAHRKGRPPRLRVRRVVLSAAGVELFKRRARGKLPGASLFTEDGAQPWRRHIWARETRAAIAKANDQAGRDPAARIPAGASAYSFRHARISELLQVHGVDPLTVAQQTGTSLAMIEKAYFRFIPAAVEAKLAAVKDGEL
jgi:integrase